MSKYNVSIAGADVVVVGDAPIPYKCCANCENWRRNGEFLMGECVVNYCDKYGTLKEAADSDHCTWGYEDKDV